MVDEDEFTRVIHPVAGMKLIEINTCAKVTLMNLYHIATNGCMAHDLLPMEI